MLLLLEKKERKTSKAVVIGYGNSIHLWPHKQPNRVAYTSSHHLLFSQIYRFGFSRDGLSLLCMESTGTAGLRQEDLLPKCFSHSAGKMVLVVGFSPYRPFYGQLGLPPQHRGLGNVKELGAIF